VLFVVDVFVSNALVVNQFLASNVRAILEIQLASLVVLITVVSIEVYRSAHSVGAGIGCFLGLSVVGAGIMWFWSWFQAHMLVSDMNSEQGSGAKPAFFTQLGFQPGQGHYAVDASANHILRVVYGPTAWLLALAGCVTTVAVKAGMTMLRPAE